MLIEERPATRIPTVPQAFPPEIRASNEPAQESSFGRVRKRDSRQYY